MSRPLMYLSFADDDDWLGGCYVPGTDVVEGVRMAWACGCNPGGQVLGLPVPDDVEIPAEKIAVLITDPHVLELDG